MKLMLLAALLFPAQLIACSSSAIPQKIGRDFVVEVHDRGTAVPGLNIELSIVPSKENSPSRSVKVVSTDSTGSARFLGIKRGLYFVGIKHPAFPYSVEVEVVGKRDEDLDSKVRFDWPSSHFLETTVVSGELDGHISTGMRAEDFVRDVRDPRYAAIAGAKLTLLKYVSQEIVASVTSDDQGRFNFGDIPSGSYFLRVQTPKSARGRFPDDGYVPIEVNRSTSVSELKIRLDQAICGELGYSNQAEQKSENQNQS